MRTLAPPTWVPGLVVLRAVRRLTSEKSHHQRISRPYHRRVINPYASKTHHVDHNLIKQTKTELRNRCL